ncbi:MAG: hypothetical protein RMX68_012820 [Aulosira sp. ZfuVER01]|nr:hypothetical protein [Aulosira sp. ZfuVER01]MDZ8001028.1 hypothetical protein [Aulosira sp. DedVER01a]MDZ8056265.1 hypothetical protein [Aulosira sp. ZfuCHP01]
MADKLISEFCLSFYLPVEGAFGNSLPGTGVGEVAPGSVVLPGLLESGTVMLPGAGATLPGVPGLAGAGATLPGLPESGMLVPPGAGVMLLGAPESGVVVRFLGAGVVSEGAVPGVVVSGAGVIVPEGLDSGVLVLPGVVLSGVGLVVVPLSGVLVLTGVPPAQREFSGDLSHRIFIPSGDILISVGELVDELLD